MSTITGRIFQDRRAKNLVSYLFLLSALAVAGNCTSGGGSGSSGNGGGGSSVVTYVKSYSMAGHQEVTAMAATSDGGNITASVLTSVLFNTGGPAQAVITKTNAAGDVEWSNIYGRSKPNPLRLKEIIGAARAGDGGFFVAGRGPEGASVVKLDSAGELQWYKNYGSIELPRTIQSIDATADGGYVAAGWAQWYRTDGSGETTEKGWMVKADADGHTQYQRINFGTSDVDRREQINRARPVEEGGYILTGVSVGAGYRSERFWIAAVDATLANIQYTDTHSGFDVHGAGADIVRTTTGGILPADFAVGYNASLSIIGTSGDWDSTAFLIQGLSGETLWDIDNGVSDTTPWGTETEDSYKAVVVDTNPGNIKNVIAAGNVQYFQDGRSRSTGRLDFYARLDFSTFDAPSEVRISALIPAVDTRIHGLVLSDDGQYIVTGGLGEESSASELWVAKINRTGPQLTWSRTFGNAGHDANSIIKDSDGYLITSQGSVIRIDGSGNQSWIQVAADGPSAGVIAKAILQTSDGGYFVAGKLDADAGHGLWLLRLDAAGAVLWEKLLDGALEEASSAIQTEDGFLVAGYDFLRAALTKIDTSGNVLWRNFYSTGDGTLSGRVLLRLQNGNFLLAGGQTIINVDGQGALRWTRRLSYAFSSFTQQPDGDLVAVAAGPYHPIVARFTVDGTVVRWASSYDILQNDPSYDALDIDHVGSTTDNGIVLSGVVRSPSQTRCVFRDGCRDIALVRLDPDGTVRWAKSYGTAGDEGGFGYEGGFGVLLGGVLAVMPDNGVLVAGSSTGFEFPLYTGFIVRTDAAGSISDQCPSGIGESFSIDRQDSIVSFVTPTTVTVINVPATTTDVSFAAETNGVTTARACTGISEVPPTLTVSVTGNGQIISSPAGIDCSGDCNEAYAEGTQVTLTATPAQGSVFLGWSGSCAVFGSSSPIMLTMNGNVDCGAVFSAAGGTNYQDGTFADSDWTMTVYVGGNGGTASAVQVPSGGNPGQYREMTIQLNPGPAGATSSVFSFHWNNKAIYDPAGGPIASIDYREDAKGPGQGTALVALQNGKVYFAQTIYGATVGTTWTSRIYTGLVAGDFVYLAPDLSQANEHPDFSAQGAPIQFGYVRANSTGIGGIGYTTVAGIDNWEVTIHQ